MTRAVLLIGLILSAAMIGAGSAWRAHAEPVNTAARAPTPSSTEGPFFKAGSPQRVSLQKKGAPGSRLLLTGRVVSTAGVPISNAKLDFWQADSNGEYDNTGFRFRGHQYTDKDGRYSLETVIPGTYPGRTPHIHVKVQAPNRPPLTTQLYLPNHPRNRTDSLYRPGLDVTLHDAPNGKEASFDFVLDMHR